jgi:hypothetical protein
VQSLPKTKKGGLNLKLKRCQSTNAGGSENKKKNYNTISPPTLANASKLLEIADPVSFQ